MSNQTITDLASLSQDNIDAANDILLAVDVSDTTMSASGTNVKITPKSMIGKSIADLAQTWNNGATVFTGFKLNVTDTASDASSSLMDLQVGGSSKFRIAKNGTIYVNGSEFTAGGGAWGGITGTLSSQTDLQNALNAKLNLSGGTLTGGLSGTTATFSGDITGNIHIANSGSYFRLSRASSAGARFASLGDYTCQIFRDDGATNGIFLNLSDPPNSLLRMPSGMILAWGDTTVGSGNPHSTGATGLALLAEANQILAQRNGTNAQTFRIYGTYTDASNYRRLYISSTTAGAFTLGIEGAGTGASGNTLTVASALTVNGLITSSGGISATQVISTNTNGFSTPIGGNGYRFVSAGYFTASSDGVFKFSDNADTSFNRLQFGGTTSAFPSLQRTGATLRARLADDSGFADFLAGAITSTGLINGATYAWNSLTYQDVSSTPGIRADANGLYFRLFGSDYVRVAYGVMNLVRVGNGNTAGIASCSSAANVGAPDCQLLTTAAHTWEIYGSTNAQTLRVYQSRTDASNYHRWKVDYSGSTCLFGTERAGTGATGNMEIWLNGGAALTFNSGGKIFVGNRDITFGSWNGGECSIRQSTAFNSRLDLVDANSHSTYVNLALNTLFFGGTTSSFARIDRNSTTLRANLADGSALTNFQAKLTTDTNYVAGAPTATGYLILYDATGTAYRVPAVLN